MDQNQLLHKTTDGIGNGDGSFQGSLWEANERQFRNILLQSPSIFLILKGPDMIIDFVNEPLLRSWNRGWDIVGQMLEEALPELKGQPFPRLLHEVYATGKPHYGKEEKAVVMHDGIPKNVFYNYVYQPVVEADGAISGITVMASDVTDQVEARKKVEESEKRFRALVTATSDVVYRMSPDWSEMRELNGRGFLSDTGEPIRDWLQKYIQPQDQQRVKEVIRSAVETKTPFQLEHQVLLADGGVGWTFSRAIPVLDDEGKIIEWFGAASDITLRKKAEEALRLAREESESSKRLYETITSSTPDLIYVFDLNYRFTYANEALLTMWGKTWDQAIGKKLLENGYEPWHAEMHEREIDEVVTTKRSIRGVVSFPHATLGKRVYDYIFVPVLNEKGEVEAVAGTTRDITEIKNAEEALKRSGEQLEALVAERTKALQRSNEDLQQFAHVASHDLKEPVRKIKTFAGRLRNEFTGTLPETAQNYVTRIENAAGRMYAMIEGVLRYSSFNSMEQSFEPVDLNEVIKNIEGDLELIISQKNAQIQYDRLPVVSGSPVLLYQLFYNLINNSLKFSSPERHPHIQIHAARAKPEELQEAGLDAGKSHVSIAVSDNGIGFNQKYAGKIFQTFSRLNPKDQYEGTGLGLALCKNIAERHHGAIRAEGEDGDGAVFTLLLPAGE